MSVLPSQLRRGPWRLPLLLFLGLLTATLGGCLGQDIRPDPTTGLISEDQATHLAADYLRGSEYGNSFYDVSGRIKETTLVKDGRNDCGPVRSPVWGFHIETPHDGWLYIDAKTGEKACSTLPFAR